jgi:hypothetical protein
VTAESVSGLPRARRPALVNGVLAAAVLVLVAATALTATPATPPSIAEFAPQPLEQNNDVQSELASDFGKGAGGAGTGVGGEAATTTTLAATTTSAPGPPPPPPPPAGTSFHCFGDPPRQIEDPQSPPCVPPFVGDNGGATAAQGVSRDEIKIFWQRELDDSVMPYFEQFFNARFQLYGRKIHLIPADGDGTGASEDNEEAGQRARADRAAKIDKVFAATYMQVQGGFYYSDQLARNHVVNVMDMETNVDEETLRRYAPYSYSYSMVGDRLVNEVAEWVCARFAKGNVVRGGARYQGQPRKLGLLLRPPYDDIRTSTDAMKATLKACGVNDLVAIEYPTWDQAGQQNVVSTFLTQNVTSVICLCHYPAFNTLNHIADANGYQPEWLVSSYGLIDHNFAMKFPTSMSPTQSGHVMGLTFRPRMVKVEDSPFWHAIKEVDPGASPITDFAAVWSAENFYRTMLLLASGIQMAGPKLTPESFQAGLQSRPFPNPESPINAGHVGFQNGSHTMTLDAAEWYFDPAGISPYPGDTGGTICYIDGGKRRRPGQWKGVTANPFPSGPAPCDSG